MIITNKNQRPPTSSRTCMQQKYFNKMQIFQLTMFILSSTSPLSPCCTLELNKTSLTLRRKKMYKNKIVYVSNKPAREKRFSERVKNAKQHLEIVVRITSCLFYCNFVGGFFERGNPRSLYCSSIKALEIIPSE